VYFLTGYLTTLPISKLHSIRRRIINECIGKDMEGSSHGIIEVLSWHLARRAWKHNETP
jgi:hypothetical protein